MKTNVEWRLWGDRDPLFGVLTRTGREKGGENPWTDEDFYKLGDDWHDFAARWDRYGLHRGTVLEVGCGAGRLTSRLTEAFERVIASDVAEGMILYAKQHITAANVDWKVYDGARLPAPDNSVDAVFSCHVLQHFESMAAQVSCFRDMFRILKPGGTFMIHIPLHSFPAGSKFSVLATLGFRAHLALARVKGAVRRELMRRFGKPYMHGVSHDVNSLFASLQQIGFARVEFATIPMTESNHLHTCVLGTKPSDARRG